MSLGRAVHQKPGSPGRKAGGRGEAEPEAVRDEARTARHATGSPEREGLLMQALASANMEAAWKRVKSNRGSAGMDGLSIAETAEHLRAHWPRIRDSLLDGSYRPLPVRRVQIPKPDGGVREMGIPTVTDRLIQQALLKILQRRIDPTFSEHSYGSRPARRAHDAVLDAQRYVQDGYRVVVDVDLEKFFDRVNHDILMERLARRIDGRAAADPSLPRGRDFGWELKAMGASEADARKVAANSRCWWRNSRMRLNRALPIAYFDRLGVPRLS